MKKDILRVYRTHKQAKETYDKISDFYDLISNPFENKFRMLVLRKMNIKEGESVLEIGFGTGHSLVEIAGRAGKSGKACGIDISLGMLKKARERLRRKGLLSRVDLCCGDALNIPYKDNVFDAVFMSFTLELFDTPEIPEVLCEIKRVLKPEGRLGVVSMSKEDESSFLRLYEWIHEKWPEYVDCRPIYVEESLRRAGYKIIYKERMKMFGLPIELVIGLNIK